MAITLAILFISAPITSPQLIAEEKLDRTDIIMAYLINFTHQVSWPNAISHKSFHLHIIDSEPELFDLIKQTTEIESRHGGSMIVSYSTDGKIPTGTHLIFLAASKSELFEQIFTTIQNQPVLLITSGHQELDQIMIDLINIDSDHPNFIINRANITQQGLSFDSKITQIKGAEIGLDILTLQDRMELAKHHREINSLKKSLVASMEKNAALQQEIANSSLKIEQHKRKIDEQVHGLEIQETTIASRDAKLKKQQTNLATLQGNINNAENTYADQQNEINQQAELLEKLNEQISVQLSALGLVVALFIIVSIFAALIYQAFRQIRTMNAALANEKEDAEDARAELAKLNSELEYRVINRTKGLQLAMERAEIASQSKSDFLAHMSHELRTPLNAIIGFSEALASKDPIMVKMVKAKSHEYGEYIHQSSTHLLSIINNLLDMSRVEAGKMDLHDEIFQISSLHEQLKNMVRPILQSKSQKLVFNVEETEPSLLADQRLVSQMIINLISNASKYSEANQTIAVGTKINASGCFEIFVSDTGVGMTKQGIERALETFGKVRNAFSTTQEGTGLGLPLTKALIEEHDGSLTIESVLNEGTHVILTFPKYRSKMPNSSTS